MSNPTAEVLILPHYSHILRISEYRQDEGDSSVRSSPQCYFQPVSDGNKKIRLKSQEDTTRLSRNIEWNERWQKTILSVNQMQGTDQSRIRIMLQIKVVLQFSHRPNDSFRTYMVVLYFLPLQTPLLFSLRVHFLLGKLNKCSKQYFVLC